MLLNGQYYCKLDEKSRLMVPSRFRSALKTEDIVITRGIDNKCLAIFTEEAFEKMVNSAISGTDGMQIFNNANREFVRKFVSPSNNMKLDSSGRLTVNPALRDFAEIQVKEEVVIVGMISYIEVWNKENYEKAMNEGDSLSELSEKIAKRGN